MSIYSGRQLQVVWTHFAGKMSDEDVEEYIRVYVQAVELASTSRPAYGLMMVRNAGMPTGPQRKRMAAAIARLGDSVGHLPLFVYVFQSRVARGAMTAVSWIVKKPFLEIVTSCFDEAADELIRVVPDLDAESLWADICAQVPGSSRVLRR